MKKLSEVFVESFGQTNNGLGVTNHYTPIQNIITAVRNLMACRLSVVVEPGEDGVSIKLHSSKFISDAAVDDVLYFPIDRFTTMDSFIRMQGLTKRTVVTLGEEGQSYKIVYYSPEDIKSAENPYVMAAEDEMNPTHESLEQIKALINEDSEEDIPSINWIEILSNEDKNVAAALMDDKFKGKISLPDGYYIKATKDGNDNKCVAIRKKYTFRKPFDEEIEKVKSIMNIYAPDNIWVSGYQDSVTLSEKDEKLLKDVIEFIGAKETDDPCKFTLVVNKVEEKPEEENVESKDNTEKE